MRINKYKLSQLNFFLVCENIFCESIVRFKRVVRKMKMFNLPPILELYLWSNIWFLHHKKFYLTFCKTHTWFKPKTTFWTDLLARKLKCQSMQNNFLVPWLLNAIVFAKQRKKQKLEKEIAAAVKMRRIVKIFSLQNSARFLRFPFCQKD